MGRWEVNANKLLATKESAHMYAERLTELATALGFDGWLEKLAHGLTWIQKMRYSVLSAISSTHFPFDLYSINAFCSRQACLLPTPKGASCANYARCVNQILQNLTNMQSGGQVDSWETWNSFRLLCEHHSQLFIALDVLST
ncbi:uncharacterized protein LOC114302063 isoform X2 [Camellia sinensis]|uniref:uncharacterized protein LOC114302063 isoform X2 n=1 Tax=Camellia sinensis TaxID=4442 RepID=UPI001036A81E|nr:uncharacterized protein LOC114302063 isoform X2 [Camellia sinensis]